MDHEYLQPGFNPNSLTVPQLRRILLEHDLKAPYKARKLQLVQVFENELVPQLDSIREKILNVKPSSKGIEKVSRKKLKNLRQKDQDKKKKEKLTTILLDNEIEKNSSKSGNDTNNNTLQDSSFELISETKTSASSSSSSSSSSKNDKIIKDDMPIPLLDTKPINKDDNGDDKDEKFKISDKKREREDVLENKKQKKVKHSEDLKINNTQTPKKEKENSRSQTPRTQTRMQTRLQTPKKETPKTARRETPKNDTSKRDTPKNENSSKIQIDTNLTTPQRTNLSKISTPQESSFNDTFNSTTKSYKKDSKKIDLKKLNLLPIKPNNNVLKTPQDSNKNSKLPLDIQISQSALNEKDISPFFKRKQKKNNNSILMKEGKNNKSTNRKNNNIIIPDNEILSDNELSSEDDDEIISTKKIKEFSDKITKKITPNKKKFLSENGTNTPTSKFKLPKLVIPNFKSLPNFIKNNKRLNKKQLLDKFEPTLINFTVFSIITIPILFFIWYHEQRLIIGYCNRKKVNFKKLFTDNSIFSFIDKVLSFVKPNCLNCPANAICLDRLNLECKKGFIKKRSILSLGGILPFASYYCVPNRMADKIIKRSIRKFLFFLRFKNGKIDCGHSSNIAKSGIEVAYLQKIFQNDTEKYNLTNLEKSKLWDSAINGLVKNNNDIESYTLRNTTKTFLRSTSTTTSSSYCKYGVPILHFVSNFKFFLLLLIPVTIIFFNLKKQINKLLSSKLEISDYTARAYRELRKAKENKDEPNFLHTLQLRDVILSGITDFNEKNRIWNKMVKNLENDNEHIISSQMEINGEILKCWMLKDIDDDDNHNNQY